MKRRAFLGSLAALFAPVPKVSAVDPVPIKTQTDALTAGGGYVETVGAFPPQAALARYEFAEFHAAMLAAIANAMAVPHEMLGRDFIDSTYRPTRKT